MAEEQGNSAYQVELYFDDSRFIERHEQHKAFYDEQSEDWKWNETRFLLFNESDRTLALIQFLTDWAEPNTVERGTVVERAFADTHCWLELVGMAEVEPCLVEVFYYPNPNSREYEDFTLETNGLMRRIAQFKSVDVKDIIS